MLTPLRSAEGPKNSHLGAKFGLVKTNVLGTGFALRFTRKSNFLWIEPFAALYRVSGIRPVLTHKYLHLKTQNPVIMGIP